MKLMSLITELSLSKKRAVLATTAVLLLTVVGPGSVSANETVPFSTTTTVVEQYDEEGGLFWRQVDDTTIEVSLPD